MNENGAFCYKNFVKLTGCNFKCCRLVLHPLLTSGNTSLRRQLRRLLSWRKQISNVHT